MNNHVFEPEIKARVVLQYLMDSKSAEEICDDLQIEEGLLSQWKEQFLAHASLVFEKERADREQSERLAELERLVGRLRSELESAKQVPAAVVAPARRNGKPSKVVHKKG
jgi:transposase-like protein